MSDDRDPFDQYHEYVEQLSAASATGTIPAPATQPGLIDVLVRIAEALEERNYMEWMRLEEDGIVVAADMPEPDRGGGDLPS